MYLDSSVSIIYCPSCDLVLTLCGCPTCQLLEGILKAMVLLADYVGHSGRGLGQQSIPGLVRNPYWLGQQVACWVKDQNL
jgi:hypothetical protein